MEMSDLIKEYRVFIDNHVRRVYDVTPADDEEREDFIFNNESLYLWAKSRGVEV